MVSTVEIDGKEYPIACNAFTPIIYSGGLRYTKANGKTRAKDINDGLAAIIDTLSDFDIPPFLPLVEFFWAFAKTAEKSLGKQAENHIPGFNEFMESLPPAAYDVTSDDSWAAPVMEAVIENFLPSFKGVVSKATEDGTADASGGNQG